MGVNVSGIIDVWDVQTFDSGLSERLEQSTDLIREYFEIDHQIFLSHDLDRGEGRSMLRPNNPYAADFHKFQDRIGLEIVTRTIRAYHYTRLTDDESVNLLRDGIHLSTPETLRQRLDAVVASGGLTPSESDQLYEKSPFHSDQLRARSGKFWLTSHPIAIDDNGVVPLMKCWGGEVASMWIRDPALSGSLAQLGRPRIIEVAVPLNVTKHAHSAACSIVATFARSRGGIPGKQAFDLYVENALPANAVLAVRTEGEPEFESMGRGYPNGFVDVNVSRWKELTGEED